MDEDNCEGKIVLFVEEDGALSRNGYYQRRSDLDVTAFSRVSEHALSWRKPPDERVEALVRRCLGIPVIVG